MILGQPRARARHVRQRHAARPARLAARADRRAAARRRRAARRPRRERGLTAGPRDTSRSRRPQRVSRRSRSPPRASGTATSSPRTGRSRSSPKAYRSRCRSPQRRRGELRALLGLRDQARALLAAEAADLEDTPALAACAASSATPTRPTGPVRADEPLHAAAHRPDRPETGEERMARITPPAVRLLTSTIRSGRWSGRLRTSTTCTQTAARPRFDRAGRAAPRAAARR